MPVEEYSLSVPMMTVWCPTKYQVRWDSMPLGRGCLHEFYSLQVLYLWWYVLGQILWLIKLLYAVWNVIPGWGLRVNKRDVWFEIEIWCNPCVRMIGLVSIWFWQEVASASSVLPDVRVPLLCLNALDDSIVDLTRYGTSILMFDCVIERKQCWYDESALLLLHTWLFSLTPSSQGVGPWV